MKLIIVPCAREKAWDKYPICNGEELPAKEAYIGGYSRSAIKYADIRRRLGDKYLILSTKYGFLHPEDKIEQYKEKNFIISEEKLKEQAGKVDLIDIEEIEVAAPEEYYFKVKSAFQQFGVKITHLLAYKRRGEAIQYLNELRIQARDELVSK